MYIVFGLVLEFAKGMRNNSEKSRVLGISFFN